MQSGGNAISVQADVSKAEDIKKLFAETTRTFGNVDILVNNAGVYEFRSLESLDEAHFRKIFDLNVLGLLLTTKEAVAHMNGQGGSIIKDRKSTRLNSSHGYISYAVFCLKKK